jgi:DNA-binding NtrC family response regulator
LVDYISHDGVQALKEYDWPGNVRELENTLERVALIHDKSILNVDDIKYILDENQSPAKEELTESQPDPSIIGDNIEMEAVTNKEADNVFSGEIQTLKELEYKAIRAGLERTNWNMTTTAQQLGISRMTLYRKLDQHGLRKKD